MVSGSSSRSGSRGLDPVPTTGGFGLLVPCDRAVICSAKPFRSYLLADVIKQYINKLILLLLLLLLLLSNWDKIQEVEQPYLCMYSFVSLLRE